MSPPSGAALALSARSAARPLADGDLLARARGGDRAAFGLLVDRHHRTLAATLRQRFGARAPVEDLLQEVFARALLHIQGFEGRSSFLTWATTIGLNLGRDWVRKEQRRRRLTPAANIEQDQVPMPGQPGPARRAETRDEVARARRALVELPDTLRLAVTLRVIEGHDYSDVAERLGIAVPLARTWVSRGLKRLRERLDEVRDD